MACTPPSSLGGLKILAGVRNFYFDGGCISLGKIILLGGGGEGHEILKENSKLYNPTIKSIFRINIL